MGIVKMNRIINSMIHTILLLGVLKAFSQAQIHKKSESSNELDEPKEYVFNDYLLGERSFNEERSRLKRNDFDEKGNVNSERQEDEESGYEDEESGYEDEESGYCNNIDLPADDGTDEKTSDELLNNLKMQFCKMKDDQDLLDSQLQESDVFFYILMGITIACALITIIMGILVYVRVQNMIIEESLNVKKLKQVLETLPEEVRI